MCVSRSRAAVSGNITGEVRMKNVVVVVMVVVWRMALLSSVNPQRRECFESLTRRSIITKLSEVWFFFFFLRSELSWVNVLQEVLDGAGCQWKILTLSCVLVLPSISFVVVVVVTVVGNRVRKATTPTWTCRYIFTASKWTILDALKRQRNGDEH